jgi:hypothetical protein
MRGVVSDFLGLKSEIQLIGPSSSEHVNFHLHSDAVVEAGEQAVLTYMASPPGESHLEVKINGTMVQFFDFEDATVRALHKLFSADLLRRDPGPFEDPSDSMFGENEVEFSCEEVDETDAIEIRNVVLWFKARTMGRGSVSLSQP